MCNQHHDRNLFHLNLSMDFWAILPQQKPVDNLFRLHIYQNPIKIKKASSVEWICPF